MDWMPYLAVAALGLALVVALWLFRLRRSRSRLPYRKRPSPLSAGELRFYRALRPVAPSGLVVFVKVRLMDVVAVPDQAWREYGAPGSGMHLDFVLADAGTLAPVLVVELDDKSHAQDKAQQRDAFKDAALSAAGVPILRVKVGRYDDLRAKVQAALLK
jgi:Protein of unknown function (DUF2726)